MKKDFGIMAGGFTNFPATKDFLSRNASMIYAAPYVQVGRHVFSAGLLYPLQTNALYFSEEKITPRPGFIADYRFFVFNPWYRENMFIHYSFEYLRYSGGYELSSSSGLEPGKWTEKDMYINNVVGLGYNLYFDTRERFGFYYILDYIISQQGYRLTGPSSGQDSWSTRYIWNNLSNHIGFIFKLTPLKCGAKTSQK